MARVLRAFVVALLAVAPSASGELGPQDVGPTWTARATGHGRTCADTVEHDRPVAEAVDSDDDRGPSLRLVAGLPTQARVLVAHATARDRGPRDRIVDGRELARRTFAARRGSSHGSDDPDAAA